MSAFVAALGIHTQELLNIIFPITLLLIFRLLLRRTVPALIVVSLLAMVMFPPDSGGIPGYILGFSLAITISWLVLFRAGLLGFAVMISIFNLMDKLPLTPHPAGWYLGTMLLALLVIAAPALYGFWTSQAGRPLFRDEILEPVAQR
ncbi:MAG TPA: hypothetical protein VGR67_00015 [Candidatus Polarisedimenticolia bacterium]|jgi:hypothetical protein|nr:hypothetical protein [Candidatus Polarisedimenticolia bacterium]